MGVNVAVHFSILTTIADVGVRTTGTNGGGVNISSRLSKATNHTGDEPTQLQPIFGAAGWFNGDEHRVFPRQSQYFVADRAVGYLLCFLRQHDLLRRKSGSGNGKCQRRRVWRRGGGSSVGQHFVGGIAGRAGYPGRVAENYTRVLKNHTISATRPGTFIN